MRKAACLMVTSWLRILLSTSQWIKYGQSHVCNYIQQVKVLCFFFILPWNKILYSIFFSALEEWTLNYMQREYKQNVATRLYRDLLILAKTAESSGDPSPGLQCIFWLLKGGRRLISMHLLWLLADVRVEVEGAWETLGQSHGMGFSQHPRMHRILKKTAALSS